MLCWHEEYLLWINAVITSMWVGRNDCVFQVSDFSDDSVLLTGIQPTFKWRLTSSLMLRRAQPQILTDVSGNRSAFTILSKTVQSSWTAMTLKTKVQRSFETLPPVDTVSYPRELGSSVIPLTEPQISQVSHISPGTRNSNICENLGFSVNPQTLLPSLQMLPISRNYYNFYTLLLTP